LVECLPGRAGHAARRLGSHVTPAAARRWAAVLLGLSLGGGLWPGSAVAGAPARVAVETTRAAALGAGPTGPAVGGGHPSPWALPGPSWSASNDGSPPGPGWTPSHPVVRPLPSPDLLSSSPGNGRQAADEVVVRRGDTLWGIAARHLGPDAPMSAIAAEWPRWYAANRTLIGPDPDVILPGQRLRAPNVS
jgi:nucleoid-associated protein YgaU